MAYLLALSKMIGPAPTEKRAQMMKFEEEEFICVDEEQERKREEELNGSTAVYTSLHIPNCVCRK